MFLKVLFFILLFVSALFGKDLQKVSLQLHWKYQFEFAGFIAAKEKGFYKDAGLDVELREFHVGQDIVKDVVEGKATYGIYNSTLLKYYLEGEPVVLLASFFKRSAMILVTTPDIHSPKDLLDKKIMADSKLDFDDQFQHMFETQGIDTAKLHLVKHQYNVMPLVEGKVDALTAFVSDEPYKLDELGFKYNILDPSDYGVYNLMMELFTSKKEATQHFERTLAFKKASIKGWEYALTHKDEIIKIIQQKYAPHLKYKELINEAQKIEKLILPYAYSVGSIDLNYMKQQEKQFYKSLQKKSNRKVEDFLFEYSSKIRTEIFVQVLIVAVLIVLFMGYRQNKLAEFNRKLEFEIKKSKKLETQLQGLNKDLGIRVAEAVRDTETKNTELRTLLGHFQTVLDTTMEMVIIVDAKKDIVDINKSGLSMLGYKNKDELIGRSIYDFIDQEDLEITKKYRKMMVTPTYEVKLIKKDKTEFPVLMRAKSTLVDGEIFRMITAMDLTEIKEKEVLLQKQSHLAQMGEMLNMIAHQWRQPLNAMSASAIKVGMKQELGLLSDEEIKTHSKFIQTQTQKMSKVIDDFMNFFKPENQKQYFEFRKITDDIFALIEAQLINKSIEFKVEEKTDEKVFGYEKELSHVVLNLVSNARDAFDGKDIENKYIKVVFDANEFEYIISVCDNAGGIPKNIIDKVFNPYFTTKEEGKGTGIGLYMSKKILDEIFNATIDVSNTNEGAKFTIKIPKGESENGK